MLGGLGKLISIKLFALFYPCGTVIISFFKYIGGGLMRRVIVRRVVDEGRGLP